MQWNGNKRVLLWYDLGFLCVSKSFLQWKKPKACLKAPPSPSEFRPEPHETFPLLLAWKTSFGHVKQKNPAAIGSMWLICLLTWMADLYGKLMGKYTNPTDPSGIRLGSFIRLGNVKPKKTWSKDAMITSSTFLIQYPQKFKWPGSNRKGSSSNYHFSGAMLSFRGVFRLFLLVLIAPVSDFFKNSVQAKMALMMFSGSRPVEARHCC